MGIGELLGVKQVKLVLSQPYTIQQLFDKIKDISFEAGQPQLVKNGLAYVIAYPPLDHNNQVQILGDKGKFTVSRSVTPAGLENLVSNMALEAVTDGWSGLSGGMGKTKQRCMELVEITGKAINDLQL